ncbi:MAG TPA: SemiSWEET family transporter [Kaistella sp.]|nr:SemiSWEET family transporter [Kaistella sp.]HPZ24717.1 SemiSWEET family transporter [Kaistella sp.]HQD44480.1 SemiSWEET family transporter [Kaistella sp.]
MNFNPEIIGLIGGFLSCITFVPQIFKTWKSKSVEDISVHTFLIVLASTIIWIAYGIFKDSISVILTNIVVFFTAIVMLWMKWMFTEKLHR